MNIECSSFQNFKTDKTKRVHNTLIFRFLKIRSNKTDQCSVHSSFLHLSLLLQQLCAVSRDPVLKTKQTIKVGSASWQPVLRQNNQHFLNWKKRGKKNLAADFALGPESCVFPFGATAEVVVITQLKPKWYFSIFVSWTLYRWMYSHAQNFFGSSFSLSNDQYIFFWRRKKKKTCIPSLYFLSFSRGMSSMPSSDWDKLSINTD